MIESYAYEAIKSIAAAQKDTRNKWALCLGDQKPTGYCDGHKTAKSLFDSLGYRHADIDYNGSADIVADLNYPVPVPPRSADLVFDGGVLEHVANIGQALMTILNVTKVGGYVIMVNPVNNYGESYYALDPQLHRDFFEANGFETVKHAVFSRGGLRGSLIRAAQSLIPERVKNKLIAHFRSGTVVKGFCLRDDPSEIRWHPVGGDFNRYPLTAHVFYVARRLERLPKTVWPSQRKYPKAEMSRKP